MHNRRIAPFGTAYEAICPAVFDGDMTVTHIGYGTMPCLFLRIFHRNLAGYGLRPSARAVNLHRSANQIKVALFTLSTAVLLNS